MRPAAGVAALVGPDGVVHALLLRSAPCAEHEMSMGRLARTLGIPGPSRALAGLPSRTATLVPDARHSLYAEGAAPILPDAPPRRSRKCAAPAAMRPAAMLAVHFDGVAGPQSTPLAEALAEGGPRGPADAFRAEWDPDGFRVRGYGESSVAVLRDLAAAMAARDLAAWRVPESFPHGTGGLALAATSAVPAHLVLAMAEADADAFRLEDAAEATGVAERLRVGGRRCLALSPRWTAAVPGGPPGETAHPVAFWLNPLDQAAARSGWYTVEQLDAWVAGRGPVPVPGVDPDRPDGIGWSVAMFERMATLGRR